MSTTAHISLAQYEIMVDSGVFDGPHHQRVELLHGEIREMNPIGARHAEILGALTDFSYAAAPLDQVKIRVQSAIRVPAFESAPEPDLVWAKRKDYSSAHPSATDVFLLIEVAESSLAYDRGEKMHLYAKAGIEDYWVVHVADCCVEVFRDPSPSGYGAVRIFRDDERVAPLAFPHIACTPATLFVR